MCMYIVQQVCSVIIVTGLHAVADVLNDCIFSMLSVAEKWQAVYTVLEAFGNASTCMNGNASRFSHIVSLDFDQAGLVTSASIQVQIACEGPNNYAYLP